jgi:8-oxo-dGTP pyrophosphatase MutT (NUDIX family)
MNNTDNVIINPSNEDSVSEQIDQVLSKMAQKTKSIDVSPKKYVLGFAINKDKSHVLLIKKNRPSWQAGLFNGIGGKIEDFDLNSSSAMQREFIEETGLDIPAHNWHLFANLGSDHFHVAVFWTISHNISDYRSVTDEEVTLIKIDDLFINSFKQCVPNLAWLIALLKDRDLPNILCNAVYNN